MTKKMKVNLSDPKDRAVFDAAFDAEEEVANWPTGKRRDELDELDDPNRPTLAERHSGFLITRMTDEQRIAEWLERSGAPGLAKRCRAGEWKAVK